MMEETKYPKTNLDIDLKNSYIANLSIVNGNTTTVQGDVINHKTDLPPQTNNHCRQNNGMFFLA